MAEILGLGCTHAPMILNKPEQWVDVRKGIASRIPNYRPPPKLLEELGDDNGLTQDRRNQKRIVDAFGVLRDRLHSWRPDVVMLIGDDQAENFLRENLPTFCLYTGSELYGYPFHGPGARVNLWDSPQDTRYSFRCPDRFARDMLAFAIGEGFDLSSSTELKGWE